MKVTTGGVIYDIGSSKKTKTGSWRTFRPVVDKKTCNGCNLCVLFCPEGCVVLKKKKADIDYDYCKGCGICANECPVKAIKMVREEK